MYFIRDQLNKREFTTTITVYKKNFEEVISKLNKERSKILSERGSNASIFIYISETPKQAYLDIVFEYKKRD